MKQILLFILIISVVGIIVLYPHLKPKSTPNLSTAPVPYQGQKPLPEELLAEPVKDFKNRITKKPFGIYITPLNSPIKPERFTGYHTGTDVEYQDVVEDVPVYAIADGVITYSSWASGYGGVVILKVNIKDKPYSVVYGHLRTSTLPPVGKEFKKEDKIALLGTGYTRETDGERKHLHLGILSGDRIDLRGYIGSKSELSNWLDPLTFY